MTGARRTTTATRWNANAARPIAVVFLLAKIGSGRNCKHAITVISLLSLTIRLRHALAENASLASSAIAKNKAIWSTRVLGQGRSLLGSLGHRPRITSKRPERQWQTVL